MNAQGLRWEEWCFDQIGKELLLCIHWEYARESPTIRAHVARYGQLLKAFRHRLRREEKAFDARLSKTFLDNFPSYFPEQFGSHLLTTVLERRSYSRTIKDWRVALPIFATTFTGRIVLEPEHFPDTPWMALPLSVREQIARRVEPSEPTLVEHQPWHKYSDTPLAHGSQIIGKVGKDCWEDVVLRIHWSEGTNEEISSAFRKWITKYLKTHARIQPPKGKRPGVNKAWLKRLGGMRLWRAGAGLEGARDIAERHIAAEDSAARKQGITRPKDPQLTNPISERADEDSMREDISRVSRDLRHLFVRGLYRYVRNPMYLSVTMIILGEALVAHSVALAVYWAVWFVCANLFVIVYEEPTLRQRFGESYDEYTQRVGRWIPKFHCSQIR